MTEQILEQANDLWDAIQARRNDLEMVDEKKDWCRQGDKPQKMMMVSITLSNERMMELMEKMQELLWQDEQMYLQQFHEL